MHKKLKDEHKQLLQQVIEHFDNEDKAVRQRQIKTWRKLKLMWEGWTNIWYDEVAHDWRIFDQQVAAEASSDQIYYDKPVNVFRAYLESIIAALSITVPPIKCFPDDADDSLDLLTAKAGDKISQLIYRHNDVSLLWLHSLFIYCTEGMVGCYSYPKADNKYGKYDEKQYKDYTEEHEYQMCPVCNTEMGDRILTDQEKDEFMPDDEDVALHDIIFNEGQEVCPNCAALVDPQLQRSTLIVTRMVGVTTNPKTRVCMESYGGLNIKVANYARKQEDTPYLFYAYETHYANSIERFPHLHGEIDLNKSGYSGNEMYERWGRIPPQYNGEYPINTVTERYCWLRPAAFNILHEEEVKKLKKAYPDGVKVSMVNDIIAEVENEALDDCWTLTFNPMSDYIHFDPIGLLLVSIQEITNELISLTTQTIEHGISQTFADPAVLDFDAYEQEEVLPGSIFPAQPKSGKTLNDGFFQLKTATLSAEVMPFGQNIQQLGQLVSAAQPSLFGGALEGSKTASEYSMSRAQALQRLQNTWKMFTSWWKNIFGKAIPMYIKETQNQGDEREVQQDRNGNFLNSFIRRAELEGKLGKIELAADENLPITWSQRKDMVFQLLQSANPEVLAVLGSPENLPIIREALGVTEFVVPGEDDRNKQYEEIKQLIVSEPIITPGINPITGMPEEQEFPSVEIDPDVDNHAIEADICRRWLVSEPGRLSKIENEAGYRNVLLHMKMHMLVLQEQAMNQQMATAESTGTAPNEKPNELDKSVPISGEGDVTTIQ